MGGWSARCAAPRSNQTLRHPARSGLHVRLSLVTDIDAARGGAGTARLRLTKDRRVKFGAPRRFGAQHERKVREDAEPRELLEPLRLSAVADHPQLIGEERCQARRHIVKKPPVGPLGLEVDGKELVDLNFAESSGVFRTEHVPNPAAAPLLKRDVTTQKGRHVPLRRHPPSSDKSLSGVGRARSQNRAEVQRSGPLGAAVVKKRIVQVETDEHYGRIGASPRCRM